MDGINNRIKLIKMSLCAKLNINIKIPKEDRLDRWIVFEMICNVLQYAAYTDVHNIRYDTIWRNGMGIKNMYMCTTECII